MTSKYFHIMSALAEELYQKTGKRAFRTTMEQVNTVLPSKQAQNSGLGMSMGRKQINMDRQAVVRRRSKISSNQVAPYEDVHVNEAMARLGLGNMVIDTEVEQQQAMKLIRAMPQPLSVRKEMRELLLKGPVKPTKGIRYAMRSNWNSFKISWNEAMYSLEVWKGALKKIEGHQGMSVVSYFTFLRWLFFLNFFIFLLIFWVITFFQVAFKATTVYDTDLIGSDSKFNTTVAETCSASYTTNVSSDALTLILDFLQGTGWMEDTAMFNGFYTDKKLELAASNYNMPLAYFLVTVAVMLVSLVVMVHNTLSNFKNTVMAKENTSKVNYCNAVFAGVDFNISQLESMDLKQKSIRLGLVSELEEQRHEMQVKNRTSGEKCKVYTARFFVNFIIILMLGGAGAAIYYAQDYSADFTTQPDVATNYHSLVILLVQFLPSIVIGVLNGAYPIIFGLLGKLEGYRPATAINFQLIRMVFLRLASLAMIVASLYVQITCSTDLNSCHVGDGEPCAAIQCWETYVGSAFYKLIVFDFIINVAVTLGVEGLRKLISSKCQCGLAKAIAPSEFDLPNNILGLVYSQTLLWIGFYFAPLVSAVSVVCYFTIFYVKYLSAMYFTIPPEKPYQASKSNSFFTIILMVAFFMICVPVGYIMSNLEPSPMCGPFRVYNAPADIITVQIDNASYWFSVIWRVVTSSAFVAALIILLILLVYYCSALKSAHKDMVTMMKEQLVLEGKDKQFLLARINELGGAPTEKKKAPPPYQKKPTVRNVDEKQPLRNGDVEMEKQELDIYGNEKSIIYSPVHSEAPPPADYNYPAENTGIGNQSNSSRQDRASKVSPQNVQVAPASPANQRQQQQSALDDW